MPLPWGIKEDELRLHMLGTWSSSWHSEGFGYDYRALNPEPDGDVVTSRGSPVYRWTCQGESENLHPGEISLRRTFTPPVAAVPHGIPLHIITSILGY